jgi:glycosyltransferase involved in cell wall biosynthesis
MKKILILVFSDLKLDARVVRQVQWASKNANVTIVCFDADIIPEVNVIRIQQTKLTFSLKLMVGLALLLRFHKLAYRLLHHYQHLLMKQFSDHSFDLIIANDIDTLPLAFQLKGKASILFDAHEYAPRHFEDNKVWKWFFQPFYIALCKKYISRTNGMLTVGSGLATEYEISFGVKPVIITNATSYYNLSPSKIQPDKIRLVHHGLVNQSRNLELMIDIMELLDDRFYLDMYLLLSPYASAQTKEYLNSLKQRVQTNARIRILPAIKRDLIVNTLNQYDIGVFLIPPVNFNYANTLPNKLFDFIQARLGIAIGPTPEMASIVKEYKNGVVSEGFTSQQLAEQLKALTAESIHIFKINSGRAASILNAEQNEKIFNETILKYL